MCSMTHPAYIREKARSLRVEKHLSIDEITKRLALPKTTIYYWVRDLPLGRARRANPGQRKGNRALRTKYRLRREAAYDQGRAEFDELAADPLFRDFVCLYIAEGYKRSRNAVSICNSDPRIVVLGAHWIGRFARNPMRYSVQYHADQHGDRLRAFWSARLGIDPTDIRLQPKRGTPRCGRACRDGSIVFRSSG